MRKISIALALVLAACRPNTVDLTFRLSAPCAPAAVPGHHVDGVVWPARAEAAPGPQRETTHLSLDAARNGPAPA